MAIPEEKYDALLAYIESGANSDLSEDMIEYVNMLELIRTMHMRYESHITIIKFLQQPPYGLSEYVAISRYSDAMNFFYLDNEIKKQAWRNLYAEKLDRAADLVLKTATNSKDIDIYKNIIFAARDMRQLGIPDAEDIPEEFFNKPTKLYSLNPELVGKKRANRSLLARHIDSLSIPESEKVRLKSDAMIEDVDFMNIDEEQD